MYWKELIYFPVGIVNIVHAYYSLDVFLFLNFNFYFYFVFLLVSFPPFWDLCT